MWESAVHAPRQEPKCTEDSTTWIDSVHLYEIQGRWTSWGDNSVVYLWQVRTNEKKASFQLTTGPDAAAGPDGALPAVLESGLPGATGLP
jgi:hypothetical protein